MPSDPPPTGRRYRPNAVGMFLDGTDRVLIAERSDVPGAWQFPQGGCDEHETIDACFVREMREELGLERWAYAPLAQRTGYRYEFPASHKKWADWVGQEQTYYLCRLLAPTSLIRLDAHVREFSQWRFIAPADFRLRWVAGFKRDVYRRVFADFFGVTIR